MTFQAWHPHPDLAFTREVLPVAEAERRFLLAAKVYCARRRRGQRAKPAQRDLDYWYAKLAEAKAAVKARRAALWAPPAVPLNDYWND